jgi:hypothetical protein
MRSPGRSFLVLLSLMIPSINSFASDLTLKQRQDPFYIGPSAQLSATETAGSGRSTESAAVQGVYVWESGIGVQLIVPSILDDSNPANPLNSTPRIGGGPNTRIEADGLFRVWGDTFDYLAFNVGVGFPWQTSGVNQKSVDDSWLLSLAVFGRVDWEWIAVVGRLNDSPSYPAKYYQNGNEIYQDATNSVSLNATIYTYPGIDWLSPFVGYTEVFPSAVNRSLNQGQGYFSLAQNSTGRQRIISMGSEFAPIHFPVLLTAEFSIIPLTPAVAGTQYSGLGSVRWLF